MNKDEIIEQIVTVLEKVDDLNELQDMLSMIRVMYNNHKLND